MDMERRRRRSPAEVDQILEDFKASHMTQRAFAESRGLSLSTLSFWMHKGRRVKPEAKETAPTVLPVAIGALGSSKEPFEIRLHDGLVVRVPVDFDATALRRLLEVVDSC